MSEPLLFSCRQEFRDWLEGNGRVSGGVWLLFGKKGGPETLSAAEALEEALCFGWIDGQMQSLDATKYKKYFARRTPKSNWSEKNKALVQTLVEKGIVAQHGLDAIAQAKKDGRWDAQKRGQISDAQIEEFKEKIKPHEPAYTNLLAMSKSVQRTYTGFFLDAKTDKTREVRLEKIIGRLDKNLKPM